MTGIEPAYSAWEGFSRRSGTESGDDRVNVRPVRGQFGCYLVWPLDLPPVPAFEFAEARARGGRGDTPEFCCLVWVLPTPQHEARRVCGVRIEGPVLEVRLGSVQRQYVIEHSAVHSGRDTGGIDLGYASGRQRVSAGVHVKVEKVIAPSLAQPGVLPDPGLLMPEEVVRTDTSAEHPGVDQVGSSQDDALADNRALVVSHEVDRPRHCFQFVDYPVAVGVPRAAEAGGCVAAKTRQLEGDGVVTLQQ